MNEQPLNEAHGLEPRATHGQDAHATANATAHAMWAGWRGAIGVAIAVALLYFLMAGMSTLWDRDEALYARYTVEMVESGNYLYATYNQPPGATGLEHVMADKPPLLYWLMSVPMRAFGPTELACRLFGPLATALACLLIYAIGRRLLDPQAGIMAMAMYGLTLLAGMLGTAALCDPLLMAFSMGVMLIVAKALLDGQFKFRHLLLMAVCFGGALLSKSAFGVLPLFAAAGIAIQNRLSGRPASVGMKFLVLCGVAAVLGAAIFFAWFIPADVATGGLFVKTHLGKHILARATSAMEHHGGSGIMYFVLIPLYVVVVYFGFFPWTLFLPGAVSAAMGGRLGGPKGKVFLVGWFVPIFVMVSLVATKLPHYIIFCMPALALAAAGVIRADKLGLLNDRDRKWLKRGRWLFAPVAFAMAAAGLLAPTCVPPLAKWLLPAKSLATVEQWFPLMRDLVVPGAFLGLTSLIMGIIGLREHAAGRYAKCVWELVCYMAVMFAAVALLAVPVIEKYKVAPAIGRVVREIVPPGQGFIAMDYQEPSLVFYAGRPIVQPMSHNYRPRVIVDWSDLRNEIRRESLPVNILMTTGGFKAFAQWCKERKPGVVVMSRAELQRIEGKFGSLGLQEVASKDGMNYSKGKWIELLVLRRGG